MKTKKTILILLAVLLIFAFPLNCFAASVGVTIDGKAVNFTKSTGAPFIDSANRTLVPLRATMETFGAEVSWDNAARTASVTYGADTVLCPVGENYIIKNGVKIKNDTAAVIKDGRTYLPIRAVLEAFGADVSWDSKSQSVMVSKKGLPGNIEMTVHFIDVGQGDCTFIDFGDYEVLIDASTASMGSTVSSYIKKFVDGPLDLVIATHPHADHIGGLPKVFNDYEVTTIIDSGSNADTAAYANYLKAADVKPTPDSDMSFDIPGGMKIDIFEVFDNEANENNNSVVSLITYGNFQMLLTGDNEKEAENLLSKKAPSVDVFKAAHHGSYTANSLSFLKVIRPEVVIVSAGADNSYGHPHNEALKNFAAVGAVSYGTFKSGTITISTDGNTYSVSAMENEALSLSDAGAVKEKNYAEPAASHATGETSSGYIGNANSLIFHVETCSSVSQMSEKNKVINFKDWFVSNGYRGCQSCNP